MRLFLVAVLALLLAPLSTETLAGVGPGKASLFVVDANGKRFGRVVGLPTTGGIALIKANGEQFWINFEKSPNNHVTNGLARYLSVHTMYFASNDCSGPGYVQGLQETFVPLAFVNSPGSTLYRVNFAAADSSLDSNSVLETDGVCTASFQHISAGVFPVVPLGDLDLRFTPPFSVK